MRIAYVINSVEGGGAALPVPAVTRVMRDCGAIVEVYALTRRDGRAALPMEASGLRVHVRDGGETDHVTALRWLDAQMTGARPDVIWTSLSRATLLGQQVGRRRRIPVVSWQHAAYLKSANRLLLRATQELSALWVADSHSVADLTQRRLAVAPERLVTWPLFAADPEAPQARPWQAGETVRLGTLGRLHPVKGHDVLVAALLRLRAQGFRPEAPFEVRVAGEGAERPRLEAAIAAAKLDNIRLTGFEPRPKDFLAGLHLYVQPSRSEGLCIAAHEAMQAGLPTLVCAVGELPYSVREGETGMVAPPGDPDGLAQALVRLLTHPGRLAPMGAAARARVLERFSRAAFVRTGTEIMARLPAPSASDPSAARDLTPARRANGLSA